MYVFDEETIQRTIERKDYACFQRLQLQSLQKDERRSLIKPYLSAHTANIDFSADELKHLSKHLVQSALDCVRGIWEPVFSKQRQRVVEISTAHRYFVPTNEDGLIVDSLFESLLICENSYLFTSNRPISYMLRASVPGHLGYVCNCIDFVEQRNVLDYYLERKQGILRTNEHVASDHFERLDALFHDLYQLDLETESHADSLGLIW